MQFYQCLFSIEVSLLRVQHIMLFYEADTYEYNTSYLHRKFSSNVAQQKTLDQFVLVS